MGICAISVKPFREYRLLVDFDNGERREFDMAPYLDKGIFQELRDPAMFRAVRVSFDTIEWPNGADICPETLYRQSKPVVPNKFS